MARKKRRKKSGHKKATRKQLAALKKARAARGHGRKKSRKKAGHKVKIAGGKYRLTGVLTKV